MGVGEVTDDSGSEGGREGGAWFLKDLFASLVVFLVAVPLALGIALASGAPSVMPGLIACAVGGIVVGVCGGSRLSVSGSAAGMTLLVYELIRRYGWPTTCAITLVAGLMQIGLGWARIARTCLAITPAVVHGLMAGIGVVISLSQLPVLLGGTPDSSLWLNLMAIPGLVREIHPHAVFIGLLTLALVSIWPAMPPGWRQVPGALVAVVVATLLTSLWRLPVSMVVVYGNSYDLFPLPHLILYPMQNWSGLFFSAITVALLASIETLLSTRAIERLMGGERADLDRELMAQGLANIVSGSIGGLPVTGVIVRSATNVNAGARTRLSAVLYGVWMLIFIFVARSQIERVPLPALASLLIYIGIRLINVREIRTLIKQREAAVTFVTLGSVVLFGLLAGTALGIALAMLLLLRNMANAQVVVQERDGHWHVRIEGSVTFVIVPDMVAQLARIPNGATVDVDLLVDMMDHAAFEALHQWRLSYQSKGGSVDIDEVHERWYQSAQQGKPLNPRHRESGLALFRSAFRRQKRRDIEDLAQGVAEFNATAHRVAGPLFAQLAREGQQPTVLFITCADSRVVPDLITSTEPGHLFTLRNIGNLVPPYEEQMRETGTCSDPSTVAALEYALEVLNIRNIIVCGHSECGAMEALMTDRTERNLPPGLTTWLRHGDDSLERLAQGGQNNRLNRDSNSDSNSNSNSNSNGRVQNGLQDNGQETANELGRVNELDVANELARLNVVQQLENLRTYPMVQERLVSGNLALWGWFFDIERTQLQSYVVEEHRFVAIDSTVARTHLAPSPH